MRDEAGRGDDGLDALLDESRRFDPPDEFKNRAVVPDESVYSRAADDPEAFWAGFASELQWTRPWDLIKNGAGADCRWFEGGQLNVSVNCLDRHIEGGRRNKAALGWEGEPGELRTWTYFDLYREVNKFGNVLRGLGVGKGDRVAIYMPMIPEAVVAMLACARVGAIHAVVMSRPNVGFLKTIWPISRRPRLLMYMVIALWACPGSI